jgi:DNA-binding response OmpR family regulator
MAEILLVEDDPGDALLAEELLRAHDGEFAVTWVRSLSEAIAAVGPSIDCVLLDLGLPDTSGLEGLRALLDAQPSPAVVVLTGFDDRASGEQALVLGAQDYLTKGSVGEDTLARALRYAIARQGAEESSRRLRVWSGDCFRIRCS